MNEIAPLIVSIALFFVIGWTIKAVSSNRRLDRLAKMHAELQHKIIDKLGTSQEMVAYLGTDPGKRLLDAPVIERGSPYGRVLGSVQAGIILLVAGIGVLAVRSMVTFDDESGLVFLGVLCLALGIGFLASGYAAHALSKSYGIIGGKASEAEF